MSVTTLVSLVAEGGEHGGNVMLQTFPAALIAAAVFFALAMVTYSYKNVANRHSAKAEQFARENGHDSHGAGH